MGIARGPGPIVCESCLDGGREMCLAPIAAGSPYGITQLNRDQHVVAILSVSAASAMTLLGSVAGWLTARPACPSNAKSRVRSQTAQGLGSVSIKSICFAAYPAPPATRASESIRDRRAALSACAPCARHRRARRRPIRRAFLPCPRPGRRCR